MKIDCKQIIDAIGLEFIQSIVNLCQEQRASEQLIIAGIAYLDFNTFDNLFEKLVAKSNTNSKSDVTEFYRKLEGVQLSKLIKFFLKKAMRW